MIYILTQGDYSDYGVENVLEVEERLTEADAVAFEAWHREQPKPEKEWNHLDARTSNLRAWLIANKGARVISYGEVHNSEYRGGTKITEPDAR